LEADQSLGKRFQLTASGFLNRMDQLITADLNPSSGHVEYTNEDALHTEGLEFEISGKNRRGLLGKASYSIQNTKDPTGAIVPNSPHQLGKANFSVPLWRQKFFGSVEGQYTSRRTSVAGPVLGGFGLVNATFLARHLTNQFDISANVDNLLDKRYADSGGLEHREASIPQDGRSIRVTLTYRLSQR
jgi:outer membrane receptor protein involved in Fe transport